MTSSLRYTAMMYAHYSQNHKYSPLLLKRRIYTWKFSNWHNILPPWDTFLLENSQIDKTHYLYGTHLHLKILKLTQHTPSMMYLEYSQNHKYSPIWLKRRIYPWKFSNDITHSLHYVSELFSESRILSSCLIEETHSWLARLNHKWHYTLPPLCIFIFISIYMYIHIYILFSESRKVSCSIETTCSQLARLNHMWHDSISPIFIFSQNHT